ALVQCDRTGGEGEGERPLRLAVAAVELDDAERALAAAEERRASAAEAEEVLAAADDAGGGIEQHGTVGEGEGERRLRLAVGGVELDHAEPAAAVAEEHRGAGAEAEEVLAGADDSGALVDADRAGGEGGRQRRLRLAGRGVELDGAEPAAAVAEED